MPDRHSDTQAKKAALARQINRNDVWAEVVQCAGSAESCLIPAGIGFFRASPGSELNLGRGTPGSAGLRASSGLVQSRTQYHGASDFVASRHTWWLGARILRLGRERRIRCVGARPDGLAQLRLAASCLFGDYHRSRCDGGSGRTQRNLILGTGATNDRQSTQGLQPLRRQDITGIGRHGPGIKCPRGDRVGLRLRDLPKSVPGILWFAAAGRKSCLIIAPRVRNFVLPTINIGAIVERSCDAVAFQSNDGRVILGRLVQPSLPISKIAPLQQRLCSIRRRKGAAVERGRQITHCRIAKAEKFLGQAAV